ncbi:MAG: hypothetical protein IPN92_08470 [Chromatiaceae bacterium]|nr:hypothetical protein [Chromatiaceae bacterium]
MNTAFADNILNIYVTGLLVRIDFGTVVRVINPNGQEETKTTITQQLVMTADRAQERQTFLNR